MQTLLFPAAALELVGPAFPQQQEAVDTTEEKQELTRVPAEPSSGPSLSTLQAKRSLDRHW